MWSKSPFIFAFTILALCLVSESSAILVIHEETWDSGFQGWSNETGFATTISNPGVGGNPDGYFRIDFDAQGPPPPPGENYDIVRTYSTPADSLFTGNYIEQGLQGVQFDFFAEDRSPAFVTVYFGVSTNANVWRYTNMAIGDVGTWTTLRAYFDFNAGWSRGPGSTEAQFLADLQAVDWIGVYIRRNGVGEQDYGIDNFQLFVPEPSEYVMMLCSLILIGAVYARSRQRTSGTACG